MFRKDLDPKELVNLAEWQKIQDALSEALEIGLKTVFSEGRLLSKQSLSGRLSCRISSLLPPRCDCCENCILKAEVKDFADIKKETNFKCPFGLDLFVVPITAVGKRTLAHIIVGPLILKRRKDVSEYTQDAQKAGIELERLLDALIEINVFSYNKIYSINRLVKSIFSHIAQSGYHKKRLGEMAPELRKMDPLFSRYYEEKILNSLLNACSLALDTDSGSVMTMDKKTHMLHIKVASKLDEDVINKTNIKMGEGIAGVAAATAKPIILPQDEDKRGLAGKMKRKYIKSSMIVPFSKPFNNSNKENSNDVYGVINLNVVRKNISFSQKDIALVQELINLVSIALLPLQQPNNNSHLNSRRKL